MSVFDFPRIHFKGSQSVNPGTGNNNSLGPGAEITVTSDTEQVSPITTELSDPAFIQWMQGADPQGLLRGQWNYWGDMGFRFDDVNVSAAQLGPGQFIPDDPILGAEVSLTSAVVSDINPEGFDCTQVFSDGFMLRAPAALGGTGTFYSRRPSRAVTRSLNWYRNVSFHALFTDTSGGAGGASATFIHSLEVAKTDLAVIADRGSEYDEMLHHWFPRREGEKPVSAVVAAMHRALLHEDVQGLQIRYNLYLTYPRISDTTLIKDFAAGNRTENPAIGWVLGTIAPWRKGEPESVTLGRYLKPARSYVNPYRTDGKPYYLGPGVAQVDEGRKLLSVDLIQTLPEDGKKGVKYRGLGEITIGVRAATLAGDDPGANASAVTVLGTIANDQHSYEQCGGVYDLALSDEQVQLLANPKQELVLQSGAWGALLYEPEFMVASDCEGAYLDEAPPGSKEAVIRPSEDSKLPQPLLGWVPIHVRQRGKVPAERVQLTVEQWKFTPSGTPRTYGQYIWPSQVGTETLYVDAGAARHVLNPIGGPGIRMFRYVARGQWPQPMSPAQLGQLTFQEYYTFLRVLPYDASAASVPDEALGYEAIYQHVFRYYALILPAMSKRLNMSAESADTWATPTAARYLLRTTEPELWEHWAYMPRTRDLSAARRDLLRRFCTKIIAEHDKKAGQ